MYSYSYDLIKGSNMVHRFTEILDQKEQDIHLNFLRVGDRENIDNFEWSSCDTGLVFETTTFSYNHPLVFHIDDNTGFIDWIIYERIDEDGIDVEHFYCIGEFPFPDLVPR